MKKTITIILLACLSITMAFAAGNLKVGLQAGYTGNTIKFKAVLGTECDWKTTLNGFYVAATAEYPFADELSVKAEIGAEFLRGKDFINDTEFEPISDDEQPGVHFTAFIAPKYCFELADKFCLDVAAGVNMIMGRQTGDSEKTFNFALGVGAEATCFYEVISNLEVGIGGKFAWHFLNTSEYYKEIKKEGTGVTNIAFQVNAAAKYKF